MGEEVIVSEVWKPGQECPQSGLYEPSLGGTQIALSKGDRFPPTDAGSGWVLVQATKKEAGDES